MHFRKLMFEGVNHPRENQIHLLESYEGKFLLGPLPCRRYLPGLSKRNQTQKGQMQGTSNVKYQRMVLDHIKIQNKNFWDINFRYLEISVQILHWLKQDSHTLWINQRWVEDPTR